MAELREKAKLMNAQDLNRVIRRIAHEMVEHNKGTDNMILVGITGAASISRAGFRSSSKRPRERRCPAESWISRSTATT